MAQPPVFLAKATYRQRRVRDGIRLLPVLGSVLWLIPLLWPQGEAGQRNGNALIYIFVTWLFLVVLGAVLVKGLNHIEGPERD